MPIRDLAMPLLGVAGGIAAFVAATNTQDIPREVLAVQDEVVELPPVSDIELSAAMVAYVDGTTARTEQDSTTAAPNREPTAAGLTEEPFGYGFFDVEDPDPTGTPPPGSGGDPGMPPPADPGTGGSTPPDGSTTTPPPGDPGTGGANTPPPEMPPAPPGDPGTPPIGTSMPPMVMVASPSFVMDHDKTLTSPPGSITASDGTLEVASPTSHGSLTLNGDGSFAYTPNAGFVGSDSFSVRATEGTLASSPAVITISVTNTKPYVFGGGNFLTGSHDQPLSIPTMTANDMEGDSLTWRVSMGR